MERQVKNDDKKNVVYSAMGGEREREKMSEEVMKGKGRKVG